MEKISQDTEIAIPLKNIIGLVIIASVTTAAYFTAIERIAALEHSLDLIRMSVEDNNEFRIKWPRGEMGSLPADARQDLFIESLEKQIERLESHLQRIDDIQVRTTLLEQRLNLEDRL